MTTAAETGSVSGRRSSKLICAYRGREVGTRGRRKVYESEGVSSQENPMFSKRRIAPARVRS